MAHTFNPNTREAEAGRFLSSRPAWSTKWVPGQPGLTEKPCLKKPKNKQTNKQTNKLWKSRRRNTKVSILRPSLEWGTNYPCRSYRDKVWSWDRRNSYAETAPSADPYYNQPPNADTIAYASKILLTGPWHSCLLWGYANAWQIQKWMFTVIYWMDHRTPNEGARKSTQEAKRVCNPLGGTTIWTNQYPPRAVSLAAYVAEEGLVNHQWEDRPLVLRRSYVPVQGNARARKWECVGQGAGQREGIGGFGDSIWSVNEENI
jgi:hypothetical protein